MAVEDDWAMVVAFHLSSCYILDSRVVICCAVAVRETTATTNTENLSTVKKIDKTYSTTFSQFVLGYIIVFLSLGKGGRLLQLQVSNVATITTTFLMCSCESHTKT
jgi:ABC-type iron transport system FetAB permease component